MAAAVYADGSAMYSALMQAEFRISRPQDFLRFVWHARLEGPEPFPWHDRAVLALAFLQAYGVVPGWVSCPTCGTDWPLGQTPKRDADGVEFFRYEFRAPRNPGPRLVLGYPITT